jgi:hypothetical protein
MKVARVLPLFIIILMAGAAALLFGETVHRQVMIPLAHFTYVAYLFLDSLPQIAWWILLVVGLVVLAGYNLRLALAGAESPPAPEDSRPLSRVQEWSQLASFARRGGYLQRQFQRNLSRLAVDILAQTHHQDPQTMLELLDGGGVSLPPGMTGYILDHEPEEAAGGQEGRKRLAAAEPSPESLVAYLEQELGLEPGKGGNIARSE